MAIINDQLTLKYYFILRDFKYILLKTLTGFKVIFIWHDDILLGKERFLCDIPAHLSPSSGYVEQLQHHFMYSFRLLSREVTDDVSGKVCASKMSHNCISTIASLLLLQMQPGFSIVASPVGARFHW